MKIIILLTTLLLLNSCDCVWAYNNERIAFSILKAEGNWTYGVKSVKCSSRKECKKICINTIKNNKKRFKKNRKNHKDFISYLSCRYCPVGASNDKRGLNRNWESNVRYWLKKGDGRK